MKLTCPFLNLSPKVSTLLTFFTFCLGRIRLSLVKCQFAICKKEIQCNSWITEGAVMMAVIYNNGRNPIPLSFCL